MNMLYRSLALIFLPSILWAAPLEKGLPASTFQIEGHEAFLVSPLSTAQEAGTPVPWVWYAPALPGLPGPEEKWMFEKFTAAGIAIAGLDVGESYGGPAGSKLFSQFYEAVTRQHQLAARPVLLVRSRGGLMLYNWASEHPASVSGIAGIYPVCDLTSFPGLEKAAPAYGLNAEQLGAALQQHNPVDRLAPLAKAGVPVFHIHGDVDTVVPLEKNSAEVQRRYRAHGGQMELLIPAGQGHNMWEGFFHCEPLVTFAIRQARAGAGMMHAMHPGYASRSILGWSVHLNESLLSSQKEAVEKALKLLAQQLEEIVRVVPGPAVAKLRMVPLWFNAEYPGTPGRAEYHPGADWLVENKRNPAMAKGVEFTDTAHFEAEMKRMPNFTLHELAHAYHDQVLDFEHDAIKSAYLRARLGKSYESVERSFGDARPNRREQAYAMANHKEYFAETTEAFFTRNDFFPFNRSELHQHDPDMEAVLASVWGAP